MRLCEILITPIIEIVIIEILIIEIVIIEIILINGSMLILIIKIPLCVVS